ncbi:LacI family transcriptional regulator [Bacteroides sp. 214]|uniref:LacI family DNA-binding transcriptional regulator n=1 Tax=Bacteroides sp. 214 TaxID=2302935 RepID=UPI0013D37054|nr:LacI family DNA-binding transcriptional regulator [Bacteroides sp. 214]NDW12039.1 LacI family transcriptional regulator [Bacteroides sp. 214]
MEKKKPTSLKELASELGVSISTVSRALKNSSEISEELREKIKALAKERNYRPNPFAMSLLKNAPRIIGIIVPDIVTHYYASIISGINDRAHKHGYSTIITSSYEQFEKEKKCLEDLINIRVEGIIACLAQETTDFAHFEALTVQNVPLVFFDRVCLTNIFPSVVTNNATSAQEATEHLLFHGSQQIAFIGGSNHLAIVKERKHGYLQALREHDIPIDRNLVVCKRIGYEAGYEAARQLLTLSYPPDAIVAMTDSLAFGTMKAIKELGLSIPQDIALIGYTDETHANYVDPPLTAVTHQTYKMGETACELLIDQLKGSSKIEQVIIPCVLSIRGSSIKTPKS